MKEHDILKDAIWVAGAVIFAAAAFYLVMMLAGCATVQPQARTTAKAGMATCGTAVGHYLDTTHNGGAQPLPPRAFGAHRLTWKGTPWLLVNRGNEIMLWDVSNPKQPVLKSSSSFRVGNQGDSDFDLMTFSVCDDCRWGVAWYKLATVVFDLGTGTQPVWADKRVVYGAVNGLGGMTYRHAGAQWLLTNSGVGDSCVATATLYRLAGLSDLTQTQCVTAGARPLTARWGLYDRGVLWVIDSSTRLYNFRATSTGLTYIRQLGYAAADGNSGVGLDVVPGMAAAASSLGAAIWDTADPEMPVQTAVMAGNAYRATLAPPLLVTASFLPGDQHREQVWDISDPALPVERTANIWPDVHPFTMYQSSTLVDDVLFSWRWSIAESFDLGNCAPEDPPYSEWILLDGFETGSTSGWSLVVE